MPATDSPAPLVVRGGYTRVPDRVFDELLAELSGAQLKVLLYIIRRTLGFNKAADAIALDQLVHGIRTREGRPLDRGAGVALSTAVAALRYLLAAGYLLAVHQRSATGRDLPTTYALGPRLWGETPAGPSSSAPAGATAQLAAPPPPPADPSREGPSPVEAVRTPGAASKRSADSVVPPGRDGERNGALGAPGGVRSANSQETDSQQTDSTSDSNRIATQSSGNVTLPNLPYGLVLAIGDFSREFGDSAHLPSNLSQARRLWASSGLGDEAFLQLLLLARRRVRRYQGKQGRGRITNPMAYFFRVCHDLAAGTPAAPPSETPIREARAAGDGPRLTAPPARLDPAKYAPGGKYGHLFHPAAGVQSTGLRAGGP